MIIASLIGCVRHSRTILCLNQVLHSVQLVIALVTFFDKVLNVISVIYVLVGEARNYLICRFLRIDSLEGRLD